MASKAVVHSVKNPLTLGRNLDTICGIVIPVASHIYICPETNQCHLQKIAPAPVARKRSKTLRRIFDPTHATCYNRFMRCRHILTLSGFALTLVVLGEAALGRRHRRIALRQPESGLMSETLNLRWQEIAHHRRLVVFGDSVAHGEDEGWVSGLAARLAAERSQEDWHVITAGVAGNTTLQGNSRLVRDVLQHRPHLLLVAFGLNDMHLNRYEDDARRERLFPMELRAVLFRSHLYQMLEARSRRRWRALFPPNPTESGTVEEEPRVSPRVFAAALKRIRQAAENQGARVYFLTMTPLDDRFQPNWPESRRRRQFALHSRYNDLIRQAAGANLVDVAAAFEGRDLSILLGADGVHPTSEGYRLLEETAAQTLFTDRSLCPAEETLPSPLFSVIIPNWNGAHHLPTCLDALRRQTYPHFEIIISDNGSTDTSQTLVTESYPEVRWLGLPENRGLAVACNEAARIARGDVLVMLNNDTEVEEGWLSALVESLVRHPDAGAVASKLLLFDRRDVLHSAGDGFGRDGLPYNRGVWEVDRGQYDGDQEVFGACGGAAAYRRRAWEEAGGFDEDLFMYCEDVDLDWRLWLLGWKVVFAPQARVYHRLSATGGGSIASFYTGRNTLSVLLKDVPTPILRRYGWLMLRAQMRIAWSALRSWRGEAARARLRGQLAALWHLPRTLRKRRSVQATSRLSLDEINGLLD